MTMPVEDEPKGRHETKDDGQHDGKATEELEKDVEHGDHRANPSSIIGWLPFRVNETWQQASRIELVPSRGLAAGEGAGDGRSPAWCPGARRR